MKKIGIITIEQVNNYGAELQAAATRIILEQMGNDAEIIDYKYYKNWDFKDTKMSKPFFSMSIKDKSLYWLKYRFINWSMEYVMAKMISKIKRRQLRFKSFHHENNKISKCYKSMPELYNAKLDYDVYVVGSDQVWNPNASSNIEPYFLTFAPKNKRKIAYASSFGISEIKPGIKDRMASLLNNIDEISVRENEGIKIVKYLTGRNATHVLDPTLLLDKQEWGKAMKPYPNMPEKYILIYQLTPADTLPRLALHLAKKESLHIYFITKRAYGITKQKGIINIYDAGPSEFLWLIAHATYVVTNSFHGLAFTVNFGTPFYFVMNKKEIENSRITSLLTQVGLMNRIVYNGSKLDKIPTEAIDDETVQNKLSILRKQSIDFLRHAIG